MTLQAQRKGNGCLYALLGLGALMVLSAIALAALPELPSIDLDSPPPPPPAPYAQPEPAAPTPAPPTAPTAPAPEPEPELETDSIFWHASYPDGRGDVPCVLRLEVTPSLRRPVPRRVHLACRDGARFDGEVVGASLSATQTPNGPQYRLVAPSVRGSSAEGPATVHVNTGEHSIRTEGALAPVFYVEDLSVPSTAASLGVDDTPVTLPLVRLAVPTQVTGAIPDAIAVVRGTGREPSRADPVCELLGGPTVDSGFNCRVALRCDGQLTYGEGTTGYNDCQLAGGAIASANDDGTTSENSDPRFMLDVPGNDLVVSDDTPSDWSARFELIADPRCEARDAVFEGQLEGDEPRTTVPATLDLHGEEPSLSRDGQAAPLGGVVMSCAQRRVAFTTADGQTGRGWLSTGSRSIVGTIGDRAFWAWAR